MRSTHLRVVVIGGGNVALRKVTGLLGKVGIITVIAPEIKEEFTEMSEVECIKRPYKKGDLKGYDLLYGAVDNPAVTDEICEEAKEHIRLICNFVDKPDRSDFYTPATIQKDDLMISLSSGGKAPGLLPELKKEIINTIDLDNWNKKIISYEQQRREGHGNL
ncbi:MAG: bifunctional precorrin-2 dehydrogenase/sirohydrochlorin ferrochelatase [Fibrobacterales bacterium]